MKPTDINANTIMELKPCAAYTFDRVDALLQEHGGFNADLLCSIPYNDAHWVLTRILTPDQCRVWARRCAQSVLELWKAPEVVVRYLETGDESIRVEARNAAYADAAAHAAAAHAAAAAYAANAAYAATAYAAAANAAAYAYADAAAHAAAYADAAAHAAYAYADARISKQRECIQLALDILYA